MAEDRIDSVIDIAAVSGQVDAAKSKVNELVELIKKVKATGIDISTVHSAKEYQALRRELDLLTKQTDQAAKAAINEAKVRQANANATKAETASVQQATRAKAADVAQSKKTEAAINDLTNEYKQLSLAYNEASLRAKNYSLTLGANNPITKQATAEALALGTQLKTLDANTGVFNRNVGNYGGALANYGKKAFGFIRTAANILPGLGLSGAFLLIFTGISSAVKALGLYSSKLSETAQMTKIFADINKEVIESAGKETAQLKVLRAEIENTSVPMAKRLQAVKDLKEQYPDYFKNLTNEQILTGNVADAYNLAAAAILRKARANAATNEIEKLAAKKLAIELKSIEDARITNEQIRNAKIRNDVDENGVVITSFTKKEVQKRLADQFNLRRKAAQDEIDQANRQQDVLLKIAVDGANEIIKIDKPDKADTNSSKGRDLAEADRKAAFEIEKQRLQASIDVNNKIAADNERHINERAGAAFRAFIAETDLIDLTAEYEKNAKGLTKKEIQVISERANIDLLKAELRYYESLAKAQKDFNKVYYDEDEKLRKDLEKGIDDYYKKWKDNQDKISADKKKKAEEEKRAEEELAKTKFDLQKQLATELQNLTFSILDANITRQKNAIQEQMDNLDKQKEKDIEIANQTITNTQDKANAIAVIEARANAAKEALQRRQKELDVKKAQFDKAQAIARIIQETAVAIISNLKNPVLLPLIIAISAARLAAVIATPIPKYKEGTQWHRGGLAIVGDGGRAEGITLPDGTVLKSPSTSTLMDLPVGSKVHPDFNKMMLTATMTKPPVFLANAVTDSSAKVVSGLKAVEKAIGKIPQTSIQVINPLRQRIRYGHSINEHLTRNLGK